MKKGWKWSSEARARLSAVRKAGHPAPRIFKPTLYTLPHGIEVISENFSGPYVLIRVRPHPLIGGTVFNGGITVRRSRMVMTALLGRKLERSEHVHHGPRGKHDDSPGNLSLMTAAHHNRHHKTGSKHRPESKAKAGASVRAAYAEGKHRRTQIVERDERGQIRRSA